MHSTEEFLSCCAADLYDVIDMMDPSQGPTWSAQSGFDPAGHKLGARRAERHAAWLEAAGADPEAAAAKLFQEVMSDE